MFGINFSEILLIAVISLLLFGPEQLPSIARKAGKMFSTLRNLRTNLSSQLYEQIGLQQINQIKNDLQNTITQLKQSIDTNLTSSNENNYFGLSEAEFRTQEFQFLYQPELDFEHQPELFDEIDNRA